MPAQSRKTAGIRDGGDDPWVSGRTECSADGSGIQDSQLFQGLFGEAEGEGHAGAAGGDDDADVGLGIDADDGFGGMLGVDAVPAFGDREVGGAEELAGGGEDEVVDVLAVEGVDVEAVAVGVAEGEGSVGGLGDEAVDPVLVELRGFLGDAAAQGGEGGADLEGGVEAKCQPGGEGGAELPVAGLGRGAHHLELAAGEAAGGVVGGVEGLEVFAAADEDGFSLVGDGLAVGAGGMEGWWGRGVGGNGGRRGAEVELDAVSLGQKGGEGVEDLAGIDGEFGGGPEGAEEVGGLDGVGMSRRVERA